MTTLSAGISSASVSTSATKSISGTMRRTFPAVLNSAPPTGDCLTVNHATANAGSGTGYAGIECLGALLSNCTEAAAGIQIRHKGVPSCP